jgi:lysophospholipase L1-like esterase
VKNVDRLLRGFFLVLVLVIALLAAAEGLARAFLAKPQEPYVRHPLLGPGWAPNYSFERLSIDEPPVRFTLSVNALGFRGKSMQTAAKPAGTYRIFCLGASTVENALLPEERTFPGRVEIGLAEKLGGKPRIEVANTGVAGTDTEFATAMLLHRVLPLEPDLVLVLEGHNELVTTLRADWDPTGVPIPERPPTFKDWLVGASRLVAVLDRRKLKTTDDNKRSWYEAHRADRHAVPFTPCRVELRRGIPRFKAQLHRIALLCRDAHVACVFLTQPSLYKDALKPEEEAALQGACFDGMNLDTPTLKEGMDAFNEAIREVARDEGCLLVDAAREVPQDLEHFVDDVHMTSKGNEAVAASVLRVLLATGSLPRGEGK